MDLLGEWDPRCAEIPDFGQIKRFKEADAAFTDPTVLSGLAERYVEQRNQERAISKVLTFSELKTHSLFNASKPESMPKKYILTDDDKGNHILSEFESLRDDGKAKLKDWLAQPHGTITLSRNPAGKMLAKMDCNA